jgi:hypothetical protein
VVAISFASPRETRVRGQEGRQIGSYLGSSLGTLVAVVAISFASTPQSRMRGQQKGRLVAIYAAVREQL